MSAHYTYLHWKSPDTIFFQTHCLQLTQDQHSFVYSCQVTIWSKKSKCCRSKKGIFISFCEPKHYTTLTVMKSGLFNPISGLWDGSVGKRTCCKSLLWSQIPKTHTEGRRELTPEKLLRPPHERHSMHMHTNTYKYVLNEKKKNELYFNKVRDFPPKINITDKGQEPSTDLTYSRCISTVN